MGLLGGKHIAKIKPSMYLGWIRVGQFHQARHSQGIFHNGRGRREQRGRVVAQRFALKMQQHKIKILQNYIVDPHSPEFLSQRTFPS